MENEYEGDRLTEVNLAKRPCYELDIATDQCSFNDVMF